VLLLLGLALPGAVLFAVVRSRGPKHRLTTAAKTAEHPRQRRTDPRKGRRFRPVRLVERRTGALDAPTQDAAIADAGHHRLLLIGGLTQADTSTDVIRLLASTRDRVGGRLAGALHDAAAVGIGRGAYLFGGGNGVAQLDGIVSIRPDGRPIEPVGRLPAPSSDQAAAVIGHTAYVVGGFTGSRWLDTIVAWTPGRPAHVVAHLPTPLRYAAVASVGRLLVIAGGSLPDGGASDAVFAYTPGATRAVRIARLPAPTTHAAAAALGSAVYVIGGRGAALETPTARIVAIDPVSGRIHTAGKLATPRSDLAAVTHGTSILLAGGRGPAGTRADISELVPAKAGPRGGRAGLAVANVYAHDRHSLAAPARLAIPRIYIPNSESGTVDEIDPRTFKVVRHFATGALPQHVTPAYDLRTLYVTNDLGNSLTPIDPATGNPGRRIPVSDPYNLYFTPDGRYAIVVAERLHRLDFRAAHTFRLHRALEVPCVGVDHLDFSADGRYLIASCEFSGQLIKVDVARERVTGVLTLPDGHIGMPQDVKLSPDGKVFYVADLRANGLWEVDGRRFKVTGFLHTGAGVHGLYVSRDTRLLYATNRSEGSVSVISFKRHKQIAKWWIPGGGSPDMGGVSANGKVLWLSGRYNGVVYALSTRNGRLLARIPVGQGPHGVCVWPQPGRYSLGHTGVLR